MEVIGKGSYGTVYKASYRGSLVVAKVLSLSVRDSVVVSIEIEIQSTTTVVTTTVEVISIKLVP